MAMFDNGSRADATERRMIERWCRSAFEAGWNTRQTLIIPGGGEPASTPDEQFAEWWKSAQ